MTQDAAAALFARFCLAGPILYVGLAMAIDPESFVRRAEAAAHALEAFRQRWLGASLHAEFDRFEHSPRQHRYIRCAGALMAIGAFAAMAGAAA